MPGPIHNACSRGTNRLIQDGAGLAASVADILQSLESRTGEPLPTPLAEDLDIDDLAAGLRHQPEPEASVLARRVWAVLDSGAVDVEALASRLAASPGSLAAALLELELCGLVEKLPGPRYVRASPRTRASG